jgi:hypothetical protein
MTDPCAEEGPQNEEKIFKAYIKYLIDLMNDENCNS